MAKITSDEMNAITEIVRARVSQNIMLDEKREVPIETAKEMGATALFGEKYGDFVRVITFDPNFSMELCGGTHVKQTGDIGQVFITAETAVAAGVRRIEAITGEAANQYLKQHLDQLDAVKAKLNNPPDLLRAIDSVLEENHALRKQLEKFEQEKTGQLKLQLKSEIKSNAGLNFLVKQIEIGNADQLKDLCFQLKNETDDLFLVLGCIINEKPLIAVSISDSLVSSKSLNAGQLIREWAKLINGGGGGQPFYASAGGKDVNGLKSVIDTATEFASKL
jgi:alanyl-tRNA synthetase